MRTAVIRAQQSWAAAKKKPHDPRGYVAAVTDNLRRPLSAKAEAQFRIGDGGELQDRPAKDGRAARPAKMRALHSSSALAVNVFDHWEQDELSILGRALGLGTLRGVAFEQQFSTGLGGTPPNLDLVLQLSEHRIVGVESKFTEWMPASRKASSPFKDKYFPKTEELWAQRGLSNCQRLAQELHELRRDYAHLNAPQLLKHLLGLASARPPKVELLYLFYDAPGAASNRHAAEIEDFAAAIDQSISFWSMRYQDLFERLELELNGRRSEYTQYLRERYFRLAAV